ncbi:polysaccharide export outer membrane protein [Filimonas lacunae]|uniref:Polysaccharide export outer membrane protein n=1 Tax=Filimonas lacunae TaxID=477680 RepID=A0A173MH13_9BACT|nr:response regulator [Filimonas lacunae]BAV06893.1 response regulator [Filimonas lacunae]SIS98244.1 polysaccharide export outer membrane protein [Filimonas lacunae]
METSNPVKIFLVDDDAFCLHVYQQHLTKLGYSNLSLFESGADCLHHLTENPDIIFLDHGMRELTGIDVLKKIKRFNPDIYVVFLSGQEHIETAVSALKYGAFDYIVKGELDLENMTKVLAKIAEVREMLRKNNPNSFRRFFSLI